jgi:ketosteroid isomerase-like protein
MQADLDLVRSIYAHWERGDWSQADWADADIEFVMADGPDQRTIRGLPAMARVWGEFLTAWSGYAITGEEFRELGDGKVLALLHATGRGKSSGVGITASDRGANIFTIRDGAVTRLAIYFDHRNALADLGLAS